MTQPSASFTEIAKVLYGDALDPRELWELAKLDSADVHVNAPVKVKKPQPGPKQLKREREVARAGLAASSVAAVGGLHALYLTGKEAPGKIAEAGKIGRRAAIAGAAGWGLLHTTELGGDALALHAQHRALVAATPPPKQPPKVPTGKLKPATAPKTTSVAKAMALIGKPPGNGRHWRPPKITRPPLPRFRPVQVVMSDEQAAKHAEALARAGRSSRRLMLAGAGVTGAVIGHEIGLHKPRPNEAVKKSLRPVSTAARTPGTPTLKAGVRPVNSGGVGRGLGRRGRALGSSATPAPEERELKKAVWSGEIAKVDADKRQVFGFCSVTEVNGQPVVDRQGDYLPLEEVEKSAYTYVLESRKGGDMHARVTKGLSTEWSQPKHTADLIESVVFTPEKLDAMGLISKTGSLGWWVGFKVNDDEQWNLVKSGQRTAFSIHGTGARSDMVMA
jgi:hypothetical protein